MFSGEQCLLKMDVSSMKNLTRKSLNEGIEYGGYIAEDCSLTKITKGEKHGVCLPPKPEKAVGSFHTHPSKYDSKFRTRFSRNDLLHGITSRALIMCLGAEWTQDRSDVKCFCANPEELEKVRSWYYKTEPSLALREIELKNPYKQCIRQ